MGNRCEDQAIQAIPEKKPYWIDYIGLGLLAIIVILLILVTVVLYKSIPNLMARIQAVFGQNRNQQATQMTNIQQQRTNTKQQKTKATDATTSNEAEDFL